MSTIAERIAEQFGNDGQEYENAEGEALCDVCYPEARRAIHGENAVKFVFPDGSSLIDYAQCWDFGVNDDPECFCAAEEHRHWGHENCPLEGVEEGPDDLRIRANWSQSASTIEYQFVGHDEPDQWHSTPFQVAECGHRSGEGVRLVAEWLDLQGG